MNAPGTRSGARPGGRYAGAVSQLVDLIDSRLARTLRNHPRLFVVNPRAGTRRRHRELQRVMRGVGPTRGVDRRAAETVVAWTRDAAEAAEVVRSFVAASRGGATPIVVSVGGDGTHNQVLRCGVASPDSQWFLRIPIGSGNDGVDEHTLGELPHLLEQALEPRAVPAIEVETGDRRLYGFNIVSVGIDAYITAMHDRLRSTLPGNTYRLVTNLAVLYYERLIDLREMTIATPHGALDPGRYMLVAMGVSGHRTYGDHMRVLPTTDNVCAIRHSGLRDKLRMKSLFFAGRHVDEPITSMTFAHELTIAYEGRMHLQSDGEAVLLDATEFPIVLRVIPHAVRVLSAARVAQSAARR